MELPQPSVFWRSTMTLPIYQYKAIRSRLTDKDALSWAERTLSLMPCRTFPYPFGSVGDVRRIAVAPLFAPAFSARLIPASDCASGSCTIRGPHLCNGSLHNSHRRSASAFLRHPPYGSWQ